MDSAAWITETLRAYPEWVVFAIALFAFVESLAIAGIVVPGVALLFAAAFAAGGAHLGVWQALGAAFVGAVLGDGISYLLGRRFAEPIRRFGPLARRPALLARGEEFFHRHGTWGVVIGRFVGPIRPITPMVSGMMGMGAPRFFTVNLLSAVGWAPVYILPGYLAGASLSGAVHLPANALVGVVALALYIWLLVRGGRSLWRNLERDGIWFRRRLAGHSWLWQPLSASDAVDTKASMIAAGLWVFSGIALLLVGLQQLPLLAGWRRFLGELWTLLLTLA